MIDNPENGQITQMRDKEADPVQSARTATAVEEPDKQATHTPTTEPAQAAQSAGDQSPATAKRFPAAAEPVSQAEFSTELVNFRKRFEQILAEFIGQPRAAVDKAETLIDGLVDALRSQLQSIHSKVESETDTEQLRVAMLSYRELFDSLGGHRPA